MQIVFLNPVLSRIRVDSPKHLSGMSLNDLEDKKLKKYK